MLYILFQNFFYCASELQKYLTTGQMLNKCILLFNKDPKEPIGSY